MHAEEKERDTDLFINKMCSKCVMDPSVNVHNESKYVR